MNRRQLEIALETVEGFRNPSPDLEQYATPADIASHLLHLAQMNSELENRLVIDLGCGTGILGIGGAILGGRVIGVDTDSEAVHKALENAKSLGTHDETDWVCSRVEDFCINNGYETTVVMNPPFGAQDSGADRPFLKKAEEIGGVAYTIHNEGSLEFVEDFVDGEVTHAFEARFNLPYQFDFHEEDSKEISVEVYRIEF